MLQSRSQSSEYIRLEGLQKLTNVTVHDGDLCIPCTGGEQSTVKYAHKGHLLDLSGIPLW